MLCQDKMGAVCYIVYIFVAVYVNILYQYYINMYIIFIV